MVRSLQPWIDGFALQSENGKDALVGESQRFLTDEAFERLDAQREFAAGEGAFGSDVPGAETFEAPYPGSASGAGPP